MSNNLLSGHQIILVDQVADIAPTEIVPTEVLQACLQTALFQDLDQRIRCQVSIFSRDDPFGVRLDWSSRSTKTMVVPLAPSVEHSIDGLCARKQKCDKACRIESS